MKRAILLFVLFNLLIGGGALALAAQPSDPDWLQIPVDGAICARGTRYSFFVHHGSPDQLIVYFEGGGACWNADTCRSGGPFDDSVDAHELALYGGIFDFTNPHNPVADYSIVVVADCTADVHIGSSTRTFNTGGADFTIHFNGFTNAQAVLDWTYAHFDHPSDLIVTGSSAGAYGAIFNAPYLLAHYPDAHAVILGDAGSGVVPAGWDGFITWGAPDNIASLPGYNGVTPAVDFLDSLYVAAARAFPAASLAQYTTDADAVQIGFYMLGGGALDDWVTGMRNNFAALDQLSNFHSYVAWGATHTILPTPLFYTMQVNGVPFRDWFASLINHQSVTDVQCDDCQKPELVSGQ